MTLQVIGGLCIVIALVGEGLKAGAVEIPRLSKVRIVALVAVGVVFVGLGLFTNEQAGLSGEPAGPGRSGGRSGQVAPAAPDPAIGRSAGWPR